MEMMSGLAYLDPSLGSVLPQMLIGALVGAGIFFRRGLLSFLSVFRKCRVDAESSLGK